MHMVTNLEACYDCQLPNMYGIIEESVRVD